MIKFKQITKDDISSFKPTVDSLSLEDLTSKDILTKLDLVADISIDGFQKSLSSNKVDSDELNMLIKHDFARDFFDQEFSESLNGFSNFVNYEVLSIGIELNNTFDPKKDINNLVDAINQGIEKQLVNFFGKNESKVLAAMKADKDEENLCNIDNRIQGNVNDRIEEDYNETIRSILLNSKSMPNKYNTNDKPCLDYSHLNRLPLDKTIPPGLNPYDKVHAQKEIRDGADDMFDKIKKDTGLVELVDHLPEFNCRIHLSKKGIDYLNTVLKEETNAYYKSLGLDPKTHYKKEKKTNRLNP